MKTKLDELIAIKKAEMAAAGGPRTRGHATRALLPRIEQLSEMLTIGLNLGEMVDLLDQAGIKVSYHSLRSFLMKHLTSQYRETRGVDTAARKTVKVEAPDRSDDQILEAFDRAIADRHNDKILKAIDEALANIKDTLTVNDYTFSLTLIPDTVCIGSSWDLWGSLAVATPSYSLFDRTGWCEGGGKSIDELPPGLAREMIERLGNNYFYVYLAQEVRKFSADLEKVKALIARVPSPKTAQSLTQAREISEYFQKLSSKP
jgi:hypothetical protein